jgi:hypothetical protein
LVASIGGLVGNAITALPPPNEAPSEKVVVVGIFIQWHTPSRQTTGNKPDGGQ